jgi:enoyl-CoA hydratase/carnithine racemase
MTYKFIKYECKGQIAYVTINRPNKLNSLHPFADEEMLDAFTQFKNHPDMLVAIVTGIGKRAFSTGRDLEYFLEHRRKDLTKLKDRTPLGGITSDFTCWKPIIAAINGYALGGGLELALACDIIVAANHAKLGFPESKVGQVAEEGGVHRLPRQVPLKLAMGMILTGKQITAQEAHSIGIVNEVVPSSKLISTAERWASEILAGAPQSIRASKQMVMNGIDKPLDIAMQDIYSEYEKLLTCEDSLDEGPRAFIEKRTPKWTGV